MKLLNNDKLINEARKLYANLSVERHVKSINSKRRSNKLERLIINAYCRYQRRLNRCVLCYRYNLEGCSRDPEQIPNRKCPGLSSFHGLE